MRVSVCSRLITLHSSFCCRFVSTEPLRGPPHHCCCLPVLQWCHGAGLCHHGDLQACINKAWQVHTGELLFLYMWSFYGKVKVVRKTPGSSTDFQISEAEIKWSSSTILTLEERSFGGQIRAVAFSKHLHCWILLTNGTMDAAPIISTRKWMRAF